ncbi:hypothetical protein R69927_07194 [Paraburkholderia domus]|nr:hypothetical protein R69927_07194 [Paraburkholderia domus]
MAIRLETATVVRFTGVGQFSSSFSDRMNNRAERVLPPTNLTLIVTFGGSPCKQNRPYRRPTARIGECPKVGSLAHAADLLAKC